MDPNAALAEFWRHMAAGEFDEASDKLSASISWLMSGGFLPSALYGMAREQAIEALKAVRQSIVRRGNAAASDFVPMG